MAISLNEQTFVDTLADGQLANSKGTIYTSKDKTIVDNIVLVNTNSTAETVNLYYKKSGGTSRQLIKGVSLAADATLIFDTPITMVTGGIIEGNTTTASKVDYTISGVKLRK